MSARNYLINVIEACEKKEFDQIVYAYLKEIYGFKRIAFTDGPYDSGIDLRVFDLSGSKFQFQVTIQKNKTNKEKREFEEKLWADVEKAQKNHIDYGYSNNLFFFYSHTVTNETRQEYERKALINYQINLSIIDGPRIADESIQFEGLLLTISETNPLPTKLDKANLFPEEENAMVLDILGFGKPSDIKLQIVESYLLHLLHVSRVISKEEIVQKCNNRFNTKENHSFYENLFARLMTEKRITKTEDRVSFRLTEDEHRRISSLLAQYNIEEKQLVEQIIGVLKKYQQEDCAESYIEMLKKIYIENFNSDLSNLLQNFGTEKSSISSLEFLNFLESKSVPKERRKPLAIELFQICKENQYIQRYCAGRVFINATKLPKVEKHAISKKKVYVDTQIILHALCYFYNPSTGYSNYYYRIVKALIQLARKNEVILYIPERYLWESQTHLQEAFNLIPFTHLPNFEKLGMSRNVFYNFFLQEKAINGELTLEQFFNDFNLKVTDNRSIHDATMKYYLEKLNFHIEGTSKNYDIEPAIQIIRSELIKSRKFKTSFSLSNDAIVLEYLSDDVEVHPLEPILLSWDKILFSSLGEMFKRFPSKPRWMILSPERYIDHYSLMKFSLDSEVITDEILAFFSNDLITKTHSLLDNIASILNPNNEVGLEYTKMITEIRETEIVRLKEHKASLPKDFEGDAVIDDVFYNLSKYYQFDKDNLPLYKEIFTKRELIASVKKIINKAVEDFYKTKIFNNEIYSDFDSLIESVKQLSSTDVA